MVDMPAKMKEAWSGNWTEGLSSAGKYDHGLGTVVYSETHSDKLLKAKGWVRESDLPDGAWDNKLSQEKADKAKADKFAETFTNNITKYGGDKERALVETMPAKEILKEN